LYTSQRSVETNLGYHVVGYIIITLLQIVCKVCQWKKIENRSIGEDMDKSKVARFYGPQCIWPVFRWIRTFSYPSIQPQIL